MVKVISIKVSKYTIEAKPDYIKIGRKVDGFMEKNFNDGKYLVRAISSEDHKELTLDELIDKILTEGTDKYDPGRRSVVHEEFVVHDYDIHAGVMEIKNGKILQNPTDEYPTMFGSAVYNFYENAPLDRGYPVRIDLLLVYNFNKLEKAKKINPEDPSVNQHLEEFLFRFKDRNNKKSALIGLVKIL